MTSMKKAHFIGICGAGMSALAVMLQKMGYFITGSDEEFYEPVSSHLKKHGIEILTPYKKENIPSDVDLIVIGKHAKLNGEENEEVREALKNKKKIKSFPEILSEVTKDRENIVVAGSYGKSTSTALLAWCLIDNNIDAGYFIGAISNDMEDSANLGSNKYFILEGDEYPAYAGVSKFLYLHPKDVLLTSAEHDHVNVFKTEESYVEPYKKLISMLGSDSLLVAGINNPNIKTVIAGSKAKIITYGLEKNTDWYPENINYGKITTFDLCNKKKKIVSLSTLLLGKHNIENIVGVSAFLLSKKIITPEQLKTAVSVFKGIERRIDLKTEKSSVLIYEGFGSSYTKARTVFEAIKLHFPKKRIVTVFEPHTFSWRNKNNLDWYNDIFETSDETLIFKPPEHGKNTHNQATLEDILNKIKKNKGKIYGVEKKEKALEILESIVKLDDLIILMSSGDMGGLIKEIPLWAEQKFPKKEKAK